MKNYKFLQPYKFANGVTVKNRIVIPPMTEGSAFHDGSVSKDELAYFKQRAGGVGMFISPAAYVNKIGKGFPGQLGVDEDRLIPRLREMAYAMKFNGTKAILQIFSAGRMTHSRLLDGQQVVSASDIPALRPDSEIPRPLTNEEIIQTIKDFGQATRRAIEAGFDGIELHGANTYLIQQFFSEHSNRRTDQWGGSIKNRMRFPLAVVATVHDIIKKYADRPFILGYRISPEELETPGIRIDDTLQLIDKLADMPIDYIHVSQRNVWAASRNDTNDHEPLIEKIHNQVHSRKPIIGVGDIETPAQAEKVMDANLDFVALGRELIREPRWVQKVESGDENSIRYQVSKSDFEDLNITPAFWNLMKNMFNTQLDISNEDRI